MVTFPRSHTVRQAALAVLSVNVFQPSRGKFTAVPSFAVGWPMTEFAPQILALSAMDTVAALARGRASKVGVGLACGVTSGLGYAIVQAHRTRDIIETALRRDLGEEYGNLPDDEEIDSHRRTLKMLQHPLRMRRQGVEVLRDINYTPGGRRAKLDIYRPTGASVKNAPVLIQIHGGAWTIGNKEQQGLMLMNRLAELGWVCVAVNYRLSPRYRFPTHIIDVKRAIAWVRANIAEYGGDPRYLVLTGGSAGGHLSALAALAPNYRPWQPDFEQADTSVAACVPFYGVFDLLGEDGDPFTVGMRKSVLAKSVFAVDPPAALDDYRMASPLHQVTRDAPDFFVLHGANDTLVSVRQARAFVSRLRAETDACVTYAELPGAQHAFEVFTSIRSDAAIRAVVRWLRWHHERWANREESLSSASPTTSGS